MLTPSPVNLYPAYSQGKHEQVYWLPAPVLLGYRAGRAFVALGISLAVEPRTVEALIMEEQASIGHKPLLLARVVKWDAAFFKGFEFDQASLHHLATSYAVDPAPPRLLAPGPPPPKATHRAARIA